MIRLFVILLLLFCGGCAKETVTEEEYPDFPTIKGGYPHLAMWWPDTWEQPLDDLKRYDWIGFGRWDNITMIENLKSANPGRKHFMDYSITETSWDDWGSQSDILDIMEKIPSEWFLTQLGSDLTGPVDESQTTIRVNAVTDSKDGPLFRAGDIVTCEYESMKITGVDAQQKTLMVQRGFVRKAEPHNAGVRVAPQITFWPKTWVMNLSTMCPEIDVGDGNGPQNWIEYATRSIKVDHEELWDGYIVDRIEGGQSWLIGEWCRSIDPDCSNREITDGYQAFDEAWYEGCESFLEYLRAQLSGKALISNTSGEYYKVLNGAIYEGYPGNWVNDRPETYEEWAERTVGENGYIHVSKSGYEPHYTLAETYEDEEMPNDDGSYDNPFDKPGFVPDYQKMRYGLTTALLADGYFSYEISTAGHGSLGLMWFDEYDNSGKGRGYLGQPLEEARIIMSAGNGSVWRREYEHGTVICNPTDVSVEVDLGGTYWLIKGKQVPEINSGRSADKIKIGPRDGRILLKETK